MTGRIVSSWTHSKTVALFWLFSTFLFFCLFQMAILNSSHVVLSSSSVMEAACYGVRIMAWPLNGDQRINANVVEKSRLGVWEKKWGWGQVLNGEEIGERIREMINDESLKKSAQKLRDAAREAVGDRGTSHVAFQRLTEEWKKNASVTVV